MTNGRMQETLDLIENGKAGETQVLIPGGSSSFVNANGSFPEATTEPSFSDLCD
jgi:prefoldin subunit 5